MLADQPLVTGTHLSSLVDTWTGADNEIVATAFAGTSGPPVLFGSGCFPELVSLRGDNGGRRLLSDPRYNVKLVEFEAAAIDVDTPGDLESLRGA